MGTRINKWKHIIMVVFSLDIICRGNSSTGKSEETSAEGMQISTGFRHHTLATSTCFIPNLFFSDPNRKNTEYPSDLKLCPNSINPLLNNNQTHIWVVKRHLHHYNAFDDEFFRCCYKSFHLSGETVDYRRQGVDSTIMYHDCIIFNETIVAPHEFVRVYCYYKSSIIYDQIFTNAITKTVALPPLTTYLSEAAHTQNQIQMSYNVLIFGMSSMSLQNFQRTMTKTDEVLKNRDVVDFYGYSRYDDTKYANLMPVLSGHKSCDVECAARDMFVWEQFKQQGFYTALIEDTKDSSISFCDFTRSPTDYYLKPFLVESGEIKSHNYCTGNKYTFKILIDYTEQLCNTLLEKKLFGVFWQSSMSSQGWDYPTVTDGDYATLFSNLIGNGYLDQTILIIMSDLGTRYNETKESYLEERLPLLKMVMPPSFREKYRIAYNNLRLNSQRLITAFDLHSTLLDLADLNAVRDEEILLRTKKDLSETQGTSLFKPISSKRTCSSVGLDDNHCICFEQKKLYNLNGITARYTAKLIVPVINKLLEPYPQCPFLQYASLAEISKFTAIHLRDNRFVEYLVRIRTSPRGVFEATVRFDTTWSVVSAVSRLDYDERKSYCVDDPLIKLYCFCPWPQVMKLVLPES
ncbi:uncharacterized protein LOC128683903 isoform X2 [Plodia interpunctella]|uniref:uncharacterized protein LOC128683903 isoform X2 n=1 Tax=Plodia interpunctella TaxID=58824 RepID=UPI002368A28B|nr:uncharacterized protein LOC128683903 isoform X2 [Plodia interpunctella]